MSIIADPTYPCMAVELLLNLAGLVLLWRVVRRRSELGAPSPLAAWPGAWVDFVLFLLFAVAGGFLAGFLTTRAAALLGRLDSEVRMLAAWGALQLGVLAGAAAYFIGFRRRTAPSIRPRPGAALASGVFTFLLCLPVMNAVSYVWQELLKLCGLPVDKQAAVEMLLHTHSALGRGLLIILAAVGAPIMEEILFRAGLFRFVRTRLPRWAAYLIPALIFGLAHSSLAFFAPLTVLGLIFSAAYERTGRISTTMIAHSLFNLNTIAMVLLGLGN